MLEAILLLIFISLLSIFTKTDPSYSSLSFIKISFPSDIPIFVTYERRFFTSSFTRITFAESFSFNSVIATTVLIFLFYHFYLELDNHADQLQEILKTLLKD